jgi:phosphatidylserine/phosphatidylglycerophosphate/cardiolipin synthase-like enzyme
MSKRHVGILAILLTGAILAACAGAPMAADQPAPQIAVYFSPHGGCTDAVVKELDAAKESVLVQAYSFTSAPIAKALMEAHKRGVKVQVILDKSQWTEKYSSATFFQNVGIPTFIDDKHAIAHNKVMVIDGRTVITGSFNFTKAAEESNAENLLVIQDAELAAKYARNWQEHLEHSVPYERKAKE